MTGLVFVCAVLVCNAAVQPGDSPLVAAAKRAVAARHGVAAQNGWVIDDTMVRHWLITNTAPPAQFLSSPSAPPRSDAPATFSSYDGTARRQEAEKERASLQREMQALAEEADQPYGGGISEDRVTERMTQIQHQLQAPPPP